MVDCLKSGSRPVAMITGAASGIGEACARIYAKSGYDLVLTDVNADNLQQIAGLVHDSGVKTATIAGDIADIDTAGACVRAAIETFGRLDAAINSAGISGPLMPAADYDETAWDRTISINLTSVWRCMRHQIPQMLANGGGAIVNISSTAGLRGYQGSSAYAASKHGVIGLTKSAARDYAAQNVRINAICPGFIRTPMTEAYWRGDPAAAAMANESQPLMRVGEPQEVAETALWLCSDKAAFVVGTVMVVDGGQIA